MLEIVCILPLRMTGKLKLHLQIEEDHPLKKEKEKTQQFIESLAL